MEFKSIVDAVASLIPTNADNVYGIDDGKTVSVDEVQGIYNGETFSIWKKQKYYYISFNSNGGEGTMSKQTIMVGVATPLSSNLFTKLGYLFSAWSKTAGGSKAYSDGEKVTDAAAAGETLALYALWNAITYYVKFNANGGSGTMANQAHTYDTAKALTANAFTRTGYLFSGWDTDDSGAAVNYSDKASVKNLASGNGDIVNLYAIWTAITWYVKFNANGGSGIMPNQAHTYDSAAALSANAFDRPGYAFQGWGTSASGSVVYEDEAVVRNLRSVHGALVILYALWKRITTVLFDANDTTAYQWYRGGSPANGWGPADCFDSEGSAAWSQIDCTDYKTCTVRIKGQVDTTPSGSAVNNTYIKIGFTDNYEDAIEVVNKWNNTSGASGQSGLAYGDWCDLEIDVSHLTGVHTLRVFIGGSYNNGGALYCSKITMGAD